MGKGESNFKVISKYKPAGDQPKAIEEVSEFVEEGNPRQTLLGVTGSGKTFTMANIMAEIKKPALVIAHNKTLAGQLCNEFKDFFPENHVEYFISYYDYYQPESYIPHSDTFIEKTAQINEEIDRLRHSATRSVFEYNDVLVVASVSCIYGLGIPELYYSSAVKVSVGDNINLKKFLDSLVDIQYSRNDIELTRGRFRVRGEIVDVYEPDQENVLRIEFFGDDIDRLMYVNPTSGEIVDLVENASIYPAKHYVSNDENIESSVEKIEEELNARVRELKSIGKDLEAQRLLQRTKYDMEMMKEVGYCNGIENYSRILEGRDPGTASMALVDYFNRRYGEDGWVCFIDESHMTLPQLKAMYNGDQSRKQVLVDYGFRLPCALDNRPLKYKEFISKVKQIVYVSATPGDEELELSEDKVSELIIRPTGLVDPHVEIKPTKGQIDTLMEEIQAKIAKKDKVIINTLTKRMAEDLSTYLEEHNIRARYLHSEIHSLERIEILRDLRLDKFDVLVGVNLLREGIDLPEVSLVCIMDADKEGYLRNYRTLIQMIGRAARNADAKVLLFADKITDSMQKSLDETERRRKIQIEYNEKHGITPTTIIKSAANPILDALRRKDHLEDTIEGILAQELPDKEKLSKKDIIRTIDKLEAEMKKAASSLDFEEAAIIRDKLKELRAELKA